MKKITISSFVIILFTIIFSSITGEKLLLHIEEKSDDFLATLFNVSGIMFSIGLSLIVTFNLSGIKNKKYIKKIKNNIKRIRNLFFLNFSLITFLYIFSQLVNIKYVVIFPKDKFPLTFNFCVFYSLYIIFSIVYFIINFMEIQKLSNDITNQINNELS